MKTAVALGATKVPALAATLATVNPKFPVKLRNVVDPSPNACTPATPDVVTTSKLGVMLVEVGGMNWATDVALAGLVLAYLAVEHANEAGSTKPAFRAHVARSSPYSDRWVSNH